LIAGPAAGYLSDRFGARLLSTGGLLLVAASFLGLLALPVDFSYPAFAGLLVLSGIGQGVFSAPNTSAIMSSVPEHQRGVASGMRSTFQNSGTALSIGVFFSLMVAGLARSLPDTLTAGLAAHGVPAVTADAVATLPPVSTLFAAFLGSNPVEHLLGPDVLAGLAPADAAALTGTEFFPRLITEPFHQGLVTVFTAAAGMALVAAIASASRGRRYFHQEARPTGDTGRAPSA
jgi:MFS family permease